MSREFVYCLGKKTQFRACLVCMNIQYNGIILLLFDYVFPLSE